MSRKDQKHIQWWIEATLKRLQEIQTSAEPSAVKDSRAAVNVCFLLQEIAETCFSAEMKAQVHQMVVLYLDRDTKTMGTD